MNHHVFELAVDWDGFRLIARTRTADGWRQLTDLDTPRAGRHELRCGELEDVTPFELGVFLATACRDLTAAWEHALVEVTRGQQLFTDLPGERA